MTALLKLIGDALFKLGVRCRIYPLSRLGWAVSSFSIRGHLCMGCGQLSHTERTHLLHECKPSTDFANLVTHLKREAEGDEWH